MSPKVIIIGCGARGCETYGRYFKQTGNAEIVALCDTNVNKLNSFASEFGISSDMLFTDWRKVFELGKIADAVVVANFDQDHYQVAMKAMQLGYNLLLEKPISSNLQECIDIRNYAESHNLLVTVCHVMRYTSYYRYLKKLIADGEVGELMGIEQTEDVGYWHMAHAFVRGNFRNSNTTSPMILQKCCHDMDLLVYLTERTPKKISSMGSLRYFKSDNAPKGATDRCVDCPLSDCPFNAVNFHIGNYRELVRKGLPTNVWPYAQLTVEPTEERLMEALRNGPWGRCVFHSDNNVVDHQFSLITFDNGLVGTLTMIGFSADGGRQTHVYGTKGEIYLDEQSQTITIRPFNKPKRVVHFTELATDFSGHGGGDKIMLDEFCQSLATGRKTVNSDIVKSVDSHIMCFAAEESRLNQGQLIDCNEFIKSRNIMEEN